MPYVELLPSGKWRAVWRDEQGRRRSQVVVGTQAAAKRLAGENEAKHRRGESTAGGRVPTWGEWRDEWLPTRQVEASTAKQDRLRVAKYLTPRWADVRLNRITRTQVQAWVNDLLNTECGRDEDDEPRFLSPATVDRIFRLMSASMKAAVLDEDIPIVTSPCRDIDIPESAPGHERYLTRAEVDLILFHLNQPWRAMVELLVGTGMRFGEAAGLHWQRVDLENGLIDIVETWDPVARRIKTYPKGKARRSVPIPNWLYPMLHDQIDRAGVPAERCGLPHKAGGARCRSGLVVPAPEGGAIDGANLGRRDWAIAVRSAGIGPTRLHDCRHTYASWLVQDGVPLQEVQRLLGHKSILTTQRYAHLGTSQNDRVLAALNGRGA
jgi:integrase